MSAAPPPNTTSIAGLWFWGDSIVEPKSQMPEKGSFLFLVELGPARAQINKTSPQTPGLENQDLIHPPLPRFRPGP